MPFQFWTTETTNANMVIHEFLGRRRMGPLDMTEQDTPMPTAPLVGSGSLEMRCLAANLRGHIYRTPAVQRGYASGRIRTLCAVMNRGTGVFNAGIYCRATQLMLLAGSGAGYFLGVTNRLAENRVFLAKSAAGLKSFSAAGLLEDIVATSAAGVWAYTTPFVMQLSWQAVGSALVLTYQQGLLADGSDLATVLEYTDASPPASPVAEGLWMASDTATSATLFFDETGTYPEGL